MQRDESVVTSDLPQWYVTCQKEIQSLLTVAKKLNNLEKIILESYLKEVFFRLTQRIFRLELLSVEQQKMIASGFLAILMQMSEQGERYELDLENFTLFNELIRQFPNPTERKNIVISIIEDLIFERVFKQNQILDLDYQKILAAIDKTLRLLRDDGGKQSLVGEVLIDISNLLQNVGFKTIDIGKLISLMGPDGNPYLRLCWVIVRSYGHPYENSSFALDLPRGLNFYLAGTIVEGSELPRGERDIKKWMEGNGFSELDFKFLCECYRQDILGMVVINPISAIYMQLLYLKGTDQILAGSISETFLGDLKPATIQHPGYIFKGNDGLHIITTVLYSIVNPDGKLCEIRVALDYVADAEEDSFRLDKVLVNGPGEDLVTKGFSRDLFGEKISFMRDHSQGNLDFERDILRQAEARHELCSSRDVDSWLALLGGEELMESLIAKVILNIQESKMMIYNPKVAHRGIVQFLKEKFTWFIGLQEELAELDRKFAEKRQEFSQSFFKGDILRQELNGIIERCSRLSLKIRNFFDSMLGLKNLKFFADESLSESFDAIFIYFKRDLVQPIANLIADSATTKEIINSAIKSLIPNLEVKENLLLLLDPDTDQNRGLTKCITFSQVIIYFAYEIAKEYIFKQKALPTITLVVPEFAEATYADLFSFLLRRFYGAMLKFPHLNEVTTTSSVGSLVSPSTASASSTSGITAEAAMFAEAAPSSSVSSSSSSTQVPALPPS